MINAMTKNDNRTEERTVRTWLANASRTGAKDVYAGKRKFVRYTWLTSAKVEVRSGVSCDTTVYASTRDISAGGLGLKVRQRLQPGAIVRVTLDEGGESVTGRVRHCSEALGGFYVGIEFIFETDPAPRRRLPVRHAA